MLKCWENTQKEEALLSPRFPPDESALEAERKDVSKENLSEDGKDSRCSSGPSTGPWLFSNGEAPAAVGEEASDRCGIVCYQ